MGIFGKRQQAYETTGLDRPDLGKRILNQIGMNLLGVDFEGQRLARALAEKQQGFINELGTELQPGYDVGEAPTVGEGGNAASWQYTPPVRTREPLSINSPNLASLALKAQTLGVPINQVLDVMKAQQPDVRYDRGYGYNAKTGAPIGDFHTELDKGMRPGAGGVVENAPGYVQSAAEAAGAIASAQEGGKAGWDLVDVEINGKPVKLPRAVAAPLLSQAFGAEMAANGGLPQGFGQGLSPGEKITQEGTARTNVERAAAQPQQFSGLQDQARTTKLVVDTIDRILPKINGWTAGLGANLGGIKGLPAHDLQADLDTIRANVGFDQLSKMRANSPTGGALGAVSERENALLQSVLGSLDAGQTPDQLAASLKRVRDELAKVSQQRADLYRNTYPQGAQRPTSAPRADLKSVPVADRLAEARRRGLIP